MPRVSVIVGVFNAERFLDATIQSLLAQTYTDFEAIIVDDGSTDETPTILRRQTDPRIKVLRQENSGSGAAFHAAFGASQGELVAFLGADDLWDSGSLAAHVGLLDSKENVQLSFSWFRVIDDTGADIGLRSRRCRGLFGFAELFEDFVIAGTSNIVTRRSALVAAGGIDPTFSILFDVDFCLRIALLRPRSIEAIPQDLLYYRRHSSQNTRNLAAMWEEWERLIDKMRRLAPNEVAQVERRARSNYDRYHARLAYEGAEYGKGLSLLYEAFARTPASFVTDTRNWQTLAACLAGSVLPDKILAILERSSGLRRRRPART
jgi:glycosyltransferase involved in cell wall biosynthesis